MKNSLEVLGAVDNVDLRKISARSAFLNRIRKKYDLQHLEGVVYTNKAWTRFRLVVCLDDMMFLDIPPIDLQGKHSMYLKVSEWLTARAKLTSTKIQLENLASIADRRIQRQKKIAANKRKKKPIKTKILSMKERKKNGKVTGKKVTIKKYKANGFKSKRNGNNKQPSA